MENEGVDQKPEGSVTKIESLISNLVREVLQVGQINVSSNFFDMGAESIHLTQIAARLHPQVDKRISLVEMFKYPTVRALSQYLQEPDLDAARNDSSTLQRTSPGHFRSNQRRRKKYSEAIELPSD